MKITAKLGILMFLALALFMAGDYTPKVHAETAPCDGTVYCQVIDGYCICWCNGLDRTGGVVDICPPPGTGPGYPGARKAVRK